MNAFEDAAYTMAALTATVALFRALVKKGVLTRDEAVRVLLDEAVSRAGGSDQRREPPMRGNPEIHRGEALTLFTLTG